MASPLDICNLALARLGDDATVASIDPPEGSAQSEHCARFYAIARDSLLEMHAWKFATYCTALALLSTDTGGWSFAYAEPMGMLRLLSVHPPRSSSNHLSRTEGPSWGPPYPEAQAFQAHSDAQGRALILTNQAHASLRFIARVTDTTKFSPLFVDALAWLLASYLAGPVMKGDAGANMAKTCHQHFLRVFSEAKTSDASQNRGSLLHLPPWIKERS